MTDREQAAQSKRHERLVRLLAEMYWKDTAPWPDRAVCSAAIFLEKSTVEARGELERLEDVVAWGHRK